MNWGPLSEPTCSGIPCVTYIFIGKLEFKMGQQNQAEVGYPQGWNFIGLRIFFSYAQPSQIFLYKSMSWSVLGHHANVWTKDFVLTIPWWSACNSTSTCLRSSVGILLLPLHYTAFLYGEVTSMHLHVFIKLVVAKCPYQILDSAIPLKERDISLCKIHLNLRWWVTDLHISTYHMLFPEHLVPYPP